jgi:hypothetical protein
MTAILPLQLDALNSEIAFAACFVALLCAMARWPGRGAIALSSAAAVLSFLVRYAGILSLAILAVWLAWSVRGLLRDRRLDWAIGWVAAAMAVCGGLVLLNLHATGYAAGPSRGFGRGVAELGVDAADFGWGAVVALTTDGLHARAATHGASHLVGGAVFAALLGLAGWRWIHPASRWSRPFALGATAYLAGMAVLRCCDGFDPLYNGRYFVPVLPILVVLGGESLRGLPRIGSTILPLVLAAPGIAVCARGISPAVAYDFGPVVLCLAPMLSAGDTVGINVDACALSPWLDVPVTRVDDPGEPAALRPVRFVVIAAQAEDREATQYRFTPESLALESRLMRTSDYLEVRRWPGCVLLERKPPVGKEP